ncbi:MlaD family protein [Amycolatopsis sp. NBC_01480]|jgi:phospholipid/cholesterol/gamma-HCH transport system substrate-binding protein|uniref:MlaD family protein n=1 Tax=Amycolatopsis sp. NBC_01480 TaxID=2903562 RepID=UPI002E28A224|nr:MlaD family protein [Amycolatopsis sp. NBC_01480]
MRSATTRSFGIGLVGLAVLAVTILFGMTASSGVPGAPKTVVRAAFHNVGAPLKVGDDVRENSSRIGRVADLRYDGRQAVVTLELDGTVPVYADARAAVWDQSALAKKLVELDRGHAGAGPLGDRVIPPDRNVDSADLDQVLDVLDGPTRDALTGTVREAGDGAAGHSQDLHDFLEHAPAELTGIGTTAGALTAPAADLPALLLRADQLAGSFQGHQQQLADLVKQAGDTAGALVVDNGKPLQDTVGKLPGTLTDAKAALDSLSRPLADLHGTLAAVRPGAQALGQATPDLRGVLREAPAPLGAVPGVAQKAGPALADLTGVLADARPLAPALSRGLVDLASPVNTLAQYSTQVVEFFRRIESMVSTEVSPGVHGARVGVAVEGLSAATGGLLPDPLQGQDAYPAPGQADREHTGSPVNILPGGNN